MTAVPDEDESPSWWDEVAREDPPGPGTRRLTAREREQQRPGLPPSETDDPAPGHGAGRATPPVDQGGREWLTGGEPPAGPPPAADPARPHLPPRPAAPAARGRTAHRPARGNPLDVVRRHAADLGLLALAVLVALLIVAALQR